MDAVFFAGGAFVVADFFPEAAFLAVVAFATLFFVVAFFAEDTFFDAVFFAPETFRVDVAAGEAFAAPVGDELPNMPAAPCASISKGPSPSRSEFTEAHVFFICSERSSGASSRS